MDLKVRDRTNEELLVRKKEFLKICDILDSLKINFFLNSGILLGAVRDNDFIKWDWDIEISVFSNEFLKNIDLISENLEKSGFEIVRIIRNKNNSKIDFIGIYPVDVTKYTIYAWQYSKLRRSFLEKRIIHSFKILKKIVNI
jgi:phosphorylcholine metabolism protein LicD